MNEAPDAMQARLAGMVAERFGSSAQSATVCGPGSTMAATSGVRDWLAGILVRYDIVRLNDAGCGDQTWIRHLDIEDYCGYDFVQSHPEAVPLDITRETMREADAVLCRDVLIHLHVDDAVLAVEQFKRSAPFLIASTCRGAALKSGTEGPVDLEAPPFNLGPPLAEAADNGRLLAIWLV